MAISTVNPATGEEIETFKALTDEEIDGKLRLAAETFHEYRKTSFEERSRMLLRAAEILEEEAEELGRVMTGEMGKTLAAATAEAQKCVRGCRYYAEHAEAMLADEPVELEGARAFVRYQPLGPVLAVMPWNFPFWQVFRFAAPALMAGNVGLLKHASNVPQTALYLEELFRKAGFPDDVFQTLLIGSGQVEAVLRDDRVVAATLTGSNAAGQAVARVAGDVIKKTVLELGGSDPFIVMPSADLDRAAEVAVTARCQNNGQSCIAAKRFFVHADVADEFTRLFAEKLEALPVGDPMDAATKVGPLATESGREDVEGYVADAVEKGATVVTGGKRVDRPGWYYEPTLVTGVTPEMGIWSEEVFGPVAALHVVADLDEAIRLANDHVYGLGSNLWTEDQGERLRFIRDIRSGMAFVNGMTTSYPELPFGGVKQTGNGHREAGWTAMDYCTEWKSLYINYSDSGDLVRAQIDTQPG